jgi:hypothetical protein
MVLFVSTTCNGSYIDQSLDLDLDYDFYRRQISKISILKTKLYAGPE